MIADFPDVFPRPVPQGDIQKNLLEDGVALSKLMGQGPVADMNRSHHHFGDLFHLDFQARGTLNLDIPITQH